MNVKFNINKMLMNRITRCVFLSALSFMVWAEATNLSTAQEWEIRDVGNGSKPAIAVDQDGIPHIGFMLESMPGFIKHAQLDGEEFTETTLGTAYYYGPLDIAISQANEPGVAVHNHDVEDEDVFLRVSGDWTRHQVSHPGHDGWDNSIVFDAENLPHTSSVDPQNFGSDDGVEYAWYDGAQWHVEMIGSGPVPYMFSTSIALDRAQDPHIVYYQPGADLARYAVRKDDSWSIETIESGGGMFPSLVLDASDNPHVTFYRRAMDNVGTVRYATKMGDSWSVQHIDSLQLVPISFTGARRITAIQLDAQGTVHVSYGDRDYVRYARLINGTWAIETIEDVSATDTQLGAQTDLDLDNDGNPHITYFYIESFNPLNGTIKYAYRQLSSATSDADADTGIKAYPNPAQDYIVIEVPDFAGQRTLPVYSTAGTFVENVVVNGPRTLFAVDHLSPGTYFLSDGDHMVQIVILR